MGEELLSHEKICLSNALRAVAHTAQIFYDVSLQPIKDVLCDSRSIETHAEPVSMGVREQHRSTKQRKKLHNCILWNQSPPQFATIPAQACQIPIRIRQCEPILRPLPLPPSGWVHLRIPKATRLQLRPSVLPFGGRFCRNAETHRESLENVAEPASENISEMCQVE